MLRSKASTTSWGLLRPCLRRKPAVRRTSSLSKARSERTFSATPGRCTFTTTSSPVSSRARCTCPMLAEPSGTSSNSENTSSNGRPISRSIMLLASCTSNGGTLLCSFSNSSISGCGSRSARLLRACASLMNVGPSSSIIIRIRCQRVVSNTACSPSCHERRRLRVTRRRSGVLVTTSSNP